MNNSNIFYIIMVAMFGLVVLAIPAKSEDEDLVDDICLGCICDAISGCNVTTTCETDACGLFRITWIYWADMGKMTVNGESPDSPTAFLNCVNDPFCATQSVQKYMRKYKQDCNGDGKIDCYDFASIHMLGGRGCPGRIWGYYARILNQCLGAYTYDNDNEYNDYPEEFTTQARIQDTIISKVPQTTGTAELQETVTEMEQVSRKDGFVEKLDNATEHNKQSTEDSSKQSTAQYIALLEYLNPKLNTTTALPFESKSETLIDDKKRIISKTAVDNKDAPISAKIDLVSRFNEDSMSSISDETDDTQQIIEEHQDRFSTKLERMEKNKNEYMAINLSLQERFLEVFLKKNRIEEERNVILKEMVKKMKRLGTRRTIERKSNQMEESEMDQREKQLRFEEKFLETFLLKNPIEEQKSEIMKKVMKNKKPDEKPPIFKEVFF